MYKSKIVNKKGNLLKIGKPRSFTTYTVLEHLPKDKSPPAIDRVCIARDLATGNVWLLSSLLLVGFSRNLYRSEKCFVEIWVSNKMQNCITLNLKAGDSRIKCRYREKKRWLRNVISYHTMHECNCYSFIMHYSTILSNHGICN